MYLAESPNAECSLTKNLFLELVESGQGKSRFSMYRNPGLALFYSAGSAQVGRGAFGLTIAPWGNRIWFVLGATLYSFFTNGALGATFGPLVNDGAPVNFAANTTQLALTSGGVAYYVEGGALLPVPWLAGIAVSSCAFLDQYFLFLDANGQKFYYSEPGDVTSGTLLNSITIEANANEYVQILVTQEQIWLFGTQITQPFYDNSASNPANPFAPNLSGVIPQGTIAASSPVAFSNTVAWLGQNNQGACIAWQANGYTPVRISNFAVEAAWASYLTVQDAVSYVYTIRGHIFWRIWFPTANVTWQYDAATGDWTIAAWRNPATGLDEAHRVSCSAAANGMVFGADRANGDIYTISPNYFNDAGNPIVWVRRAPIISNENKLTTFPWFEIDCQSGTGDGSNLNPLLGPVTPEANPQIWMRYSDDWAKNFGATRARPMGAQGQYKIRPIWMKNGPSRQRVFEITGSAARPLALNGCYLRDPLGRMT